jgi:hypothetical protein
VCVGLEPCAVIGMRPTGDKLGTSLSIEYKHTSLRLAIEKLNAV